MGSIAIVLVLLGAGILIGRLAGPSVVAQYFTALLAAAALSLAFLAATILAH